VCPGVRLGERSRAGGVRGYCRNERFRTAGPWRDGALARPHM